jgi:hypothetical protein
MGGPSPEKGPGNRRQLQVDTMPNRRKTILYQMLPDSLLAVNRTVVIRHIDPQIAPYGLDIDRSADHLERWKVVHGTSITRQGITRQGITGQALRDRHYETGHYETGHYETGRYETGHYATGHYNTGYRTKGHYESGNYRPVRYEKVHLDGQKRARRHDDKGHCETGH